MNTGNLLSPSGYKEQKPNPIMSPRLTDKCLDEGRGLEAYKEIHIWDFPATRTTVRINDYRKTLFRKLIKKKGSWRKAIEFINLKSKNYSEEKRYSVGALSKWINGEVKTTKTKSRIPLWVLIEVSKSLSENENVDTKIMKKIESNILTCCSRAGQEISIKFPLFLTPEMVSLVFHFCGDGHLGGKGKSAHYRQVNKQGLKNFESKVKDCFGYFATNEKAFSDSKFLVPTLIADFLRHYFKLNNCNWHEAKITKSIKKLEKPFLVAGLTAFIVDEGTIGDSIEIYSFNKKILGDLKEIAGKLGYITIGPKTKSKKENQGYRLYISTRSAGKFAEDIEELSQEFPTCDLAHKQEFLDDIIERQKETKVTKNGETKEKIVSMLSNATLTVREMSRSLKIAPSSVREHLSYLENKNLIYRTITKGKHVHVWSKVS